jgi:hypothetical protein
MCFYVGGLTTALHRPGANPTNSRFATTTQVCIRLERFYKVEENIFVFKTHEATRGVLNFYNAGVGNF